MDDLNDLNELDFLACKNQIRRAFIQGVRVLGRDDWKIEDDKAVDAAVLWLIEVRKRSVDPVFDVPEKRERRPRSDLAKLSEEISSSLAQPVFTPGPR